MSKAVCCENNQPGLIKNGQKHTATSGGKCTLNPSICSDEKSLANGKTISRLQAVKKIDTSFPRDEIEPNGQHNNSCTDLESGTKSKVDHSSSGIGKKKPSSIPHQNPCRISQSSVTEASNSQTKLTKSPSSVSQEKSISKKIKKTTGIAKLQSQPVAKQVSTGKTCSPRSPSDANKSSDKGLLGDATKSKRLSDLQDHKSTNYCQTEVASSNGIQVVTKDHSPIQQIDSAICSDQNKEQTVINLTPPGVKSEDLSPVFLDINSNISLSASQCTSNDDISQEFEDAVENSDSLSDSGHSAETSSSFNIGKSGKIHLRSCENLKGIQENIGSESLQNAFSLRMRCQNYSVEDIFISCEDVSMNSFDENVSPKSSMNYSQSLATVDEGLFKGNEIYELDDERYYIAEMDFISNVITDLDSPCMPGQFPVFLDPSLDRVASPDSNNTSGSSSFQSETEAITDISCHDSCDQIRTPIVQEENNFNFDFVNGSCTGIDKDTDDLEVCNNEGSSVSEKSGEKFDSESALNPKFRTCMKGNILCQSCGTINQNCFENIPKIEKRNARNSSSESMQNLHWEHWEHRNRGDFQPKHVQVVEEIKTPSFDSKSELHAEIDPICDLSDDAQRYQAEWIPRSRRTHKFGFK